MLTLIYLHLSTPPGVRVSWVKVHRFRFNPGSDFSCPFCPDQKEHEILVLYECAKYDNITFRPDFLWCKSFHMRVVFHSILSASNLSFLHQIALFLIRAGKMRQFNDFRRLQKIKKCPYHLQGVWDPCLLCDIYIMYHDQETF